MNPLPVVQIPRTKAELSAFDVHHDDWELAEPIRISRYWSGDKAPVGRHAEARMLGHNGGLCVRFVCRQHEPLVTSAVPQTIGKTIGLWDRDVCEIFVAPDAQTPSTYFEFEAAPTGEWLDAALHQTGGGPRHINWEYDSGMSAYGHAKDSEVWIGILIPWKAFGRQRPDGGERWRGNLFRCVGSGEERGYLAWQPTFTAEPNFHVPEAFGWFEFR